jgi:hypothetical protein
MNKCVMILIVTVTEISFAIPVDAQNKVAAWIEISGVPNTKTHVVPALWADFPRLNAKTTVKILDVEGPGVITQIHASALGTDFGKGFNSRASQEVIIRVFYDGEATASIDMPLMDFLGDIQCQSDYFTTVYFSKVKESHNFRLPLPFRKSIKVEIENDSEINLVGYIDIQWDQVSGIPADCGYLHTYYRNSKLDPRKENLLFTLNEPASIVAHWLQYESEISINGETICEANQELYLDGDTVPTLNYLGTEDVYGYSWGYKGTHSDNWAAVIRQENLEPAGSRIAVLRCRTYDVISFRVSSVWKLTFLKDNQYHIDKLGNTPIPYRHCVYYYSVN